MNPQVMVNNLTISKSTNPHDPFVKYDIEAQLEEVENTDEETKVKYEFTLLSNPKNIRINIDGLATIHGNQSEISQFLEQDKNNVPRILHIIYQELFPLFYTNSLAMQIPCPAYKLSQIDAPAQKLVTQPNQEKIVSEVAPQSDANVSQPAVHMDNEASVVEQQKPTIEIPTA